jgi:hypothetical protein
MIHSNVNEHSGIRRQLRSVPIESDSKHALHSQTFASLSSWISPSSMTLIRTSTSSHSDRDNSFAQNVMPLTAPSSSMEETHRTCLEESDNVFGYWKFLSCRSSSNHGFLPSLLHSTPPAFSTFNAFSFLLYFFRSA